MLTARLHGPRDIRLGEEAVPVPGRDEVLLDVTAVGLCGSDRHWFEDAAIGGIPLERPLVLGHEIAAVIADGSEAGVRVSLEIVRPGGRVILVEIPGSDRTSFAASVARRKGLTLVLCRRMRPDDLGRAIELVAAGTIDVAPLITHRYPLADVGEAFGELADRRGLKVVVEPRTGRPA